MDALRFEDLAKSLAWQLGELRHETWTVGEHEYAGRVTLDGPGQAALSLQWNSRVAKLRVWGNYPEGTGGRVYEAQVDPQRGLLVIARDINRRILSAGYADVLLVAIERKARQDQADAERASWLAQAAQMFGIDPPDGDRQRDSHRLYLGRFVKGAGYVESYGWGNDTGHLNIDLSGIPAEVALAMLAPLAEHARAQCCFTYGPHHPPQFSVTGCLYRDSTAERGEVASRARVHQFLTSSRGIGIGEAERALDAAREHGAEVIEPDGAVLAVITWDHEGCGEFTVEVPRKDG